MALLHARKIPQSSYTASTLAVTCIRAPMVVCLKVGAADVVALMSKDQGTRLHGLIVWHMSFMMQTFLWHVLDPLGQC